MKYMCRGCGSTWDQWPDEEKMDSFIHLKPHDFLDTHDECGEVVEITESHLPALVAEAWAK